ncbi:DUF5709 domain-containing protein [Pseudonocardia endophytica]|uniref:DUF5709 domain-containing protein n=1 Tax=Pseudonocardia endophytica TaxID=401976 RepID=A0A4R1HVT4_PSEEN|nr:DUF5709 domain-containing protein [Pseudonocardia endophytica]TCK25115.1 hypothetical protein EV378_0913 [Pseudonocardia endophytica]
MTAADRPAETPDPQPEEPDLASALQLDTDEALTGPSDTDPLDAGYVPPDRPYGVDDNAVTPAGEREGESHEDRIDRELPDVEPGGDPDRSGRIVGAETGADGEVTVDGAGTEVGVDGGAASAEEAAVHDVDASLEPVVDDRPVGDPEVSADLDADADHANEAEADAEWDAVDDPDFGPDA